MNDDAQVFEVFRAFRDDFGRLDRVIVNAGLGKGAPLGTGRYDANRETAMTNFVAAIAQAEAAMEIFRAQNAGHLVLVSSMSAMRGMPKSMTVYAATKAALSHLGEGLQYELLGKPIKVTVLHCGYIASEMNERVQQQVKFMVSTEDGVRSMVDAIEKEKAHAYVPALPWTALAPRHEARPAARSSGSSDRDPIDRVLVGVVADAEVEVGEGVAEAAVVLGAPGDGDGQHGVRPRAAGSRPARRPGRRAARARTPGRRRPPA